MTRFEYKTIEIVNKVGFTTVTVNTDNMNTTFNKLGNEGWELVTCSVVDMRGISCNMYYTFKRPI